MKGAVARAATFSARVISSANRKSPLLISNTTVATSFVSGLSEYSIDNVILVLIIMDLRC